MPAPALSKKGLRRSEFAFIDFAIPRGRQASLQGRAWPCGKSSCSFRAYNGGISAVATHLRWPNSKVQAAANYAAAFPQEIEEALSETPTLAWRI